MWGIIIAFVPIFFLSLLWYNCVGKMLKSQRAWNNANEEPPSKAPSISKYKLKGEKHRGIMHEEDTRADSEILIDRVFHIYHSCSMYINKSFYVDIRIASEIGEIKPPTKKEMLKEVKSERLNFEAFEEEPKVQVELQFAEGEFSANKLKETKKLNKLKITHFRFLLKPLKAEYSILTVVISYISKIPQLEQLVEKVRINKTISPVEGPEIKEHTEQVKVMPAKIKTVVKEIKTIDLPVSVKSLFGLNARELELLKKALGPIITMILIGVAFFTGRVTDMNAIWFAIMGIIDVTGIPVYDAVKKLFEKTNADSPDGEGGY